MTTNLNRDKILLIEPSTHVLFAEGVKISNQVRHAKPAPVSFWCIGGADSFLSRAKLDISFRPFGFLEAIHFLKASSKLIHVCIVLLIENYLMEVKNQMGSVRNLESLFPASQPFGFVLSDFVEKVGHVDNNTVSWPRKAIPWQLVIAKTTQWWICTYESHTLRPNNARW